MKKNYLLVNVFGYYGYSFMIYGSYSVKDEKEIIDACIKHNLFRNEEDAENCSIVEADDYDVKAFKDFGTIYDI